MSDLDLQAPSEDPCTGSLTAGETAVARLVCLIAADALGVKVGMVRAKLCLSGGAVGAALSCRGSLPTALSLEAEGRIEAEVRRLTGCHVTGVELHAEPAGWCG